MLLEFSNGCALGILQSSPLRRLLKVSWDLFGRGVPFYPTIPALMTKVE